MRELNINEVREISGGTTMYCKKCGYAIPLDWRFSYRAPAHVFGSHHLKVIGDLIWDFFK